MILWIFNTQTEAKKFLENKKYSIWDRIIILWSDQSTFERDWNSWKNINGIYIKWESGKDWINWEPWKPWKNIDYEYAIIDIINRLNLDNKFLTKVQWKKGDQWEKWEPGKDYIPDINEVIKILLEKLVDNKYFIENCKWDKWDKWVDGKDWVDWINWKDWKNGSDWCDGMDWYDWTKRLFIENPDNVKLDKDRWWVDINKNIYINRNWSILKL